MLGIRAWALATAAVFLLVGAGSAGADSHMKKKTGARLACPEKSIPGTVRVTTTPDREVSGGWKRISREQKAHRTRFDFTEAVFIDTGEQVQLNCLYQSIETGFGGIGPGGKVASIHLNRDLIGMSCMAGPGYMRKSAFTWVCRSKHPSGCQVTCD